MLSILSHRESHHEKNKASSTGEVLQEWEERQTPNPLTSVFKWQFRRQGSQCHQLGWQCHLQKSVNKNFSERALLWEPAYWSCNTTNWPQSPTKKLTPPLKEIEFWIHSAFKCQPTKKKQRFFQPSNVWTPPATGVPMPPIGVPTPGVPIPGVPVPVPVTWPGTDDKIITPGPEMWRFKHLKHGEKWEKICPKTLHSLQIQHPMVLWFHEVSC